MKVLFLPNWKVEYSLKAPSDKQPPDYYVESEPYWFFRYFDEKPEVDVLDVHSCKWLESFEKNKIRFYIWQALRAIPKLGRYDLIVSHGMQSGVVISLWRRLFKTKARHIVFDIGAFNSASESGFALKLMQFASKSLDYVIYHTSNQRHYYEKFFPWIVDKSQFIRFGTDADFFAKQEDCLIEHEEEKKPFCICVGYSKRDWNTVIKAFQMANANNLRLKLVGHVNPAYEDIPGVEQIGFIPIRDLMQEIRRAKFSILPLLSFNYSYGQMTLMQQMALGKCVIVAKVPSLVDYMEDGVTTLVYEPKNFRQLADLINKVNNDEALRNSIGENARKFICNECNEKIMAKEIEAVLNRTMEK